MAKVIRTSLRTIAPLITARLVDWLALTDTAQIFWIARNKIPHFLGPWDILLRPRRGFSIQDNSDGGGKWDTRIRRIIDVALRVQLATDETARDVEWLFADDGYFALEESVIDALQMFEPTDAQGNILLAEPMRLLEGIEPAREQGNEVLWGDGTLAFEIVYTMNLDTTGE